MPDLTDDDLAELRRLHDAATPGPWELEASIVSGEYHDPPERWAHLSWAAYPKGADPEHEWCMAGADDNDPNQAQANAELLVAMRNALPGLLAEVERLRAAAPASKDDEPATGSFVPVLPGYYEEVARRLAAAGSPPPTPAPSVTEAALAVAGYRTAEPAPVATGTVYDAVHERNNGEDYVLLVIQVPEAEYADYLGTAVEVREKRP